MFAEHRTEPREHLALPLKLGSGGLAITRDISASGLYFETSESCTVGLRLVFEMHLGDANLRFIAQGEVVRTERLQGATGVAVKLIDPRLEPAQ